jgi:hypothetical protein
MRKIMYLVGLFFLTGNALPQVTTPTHDFLKNEIGIPPTVSHQNRVSAYDDTIWFNSFEVPSEWQVTGGGTTNGWIFSDTAGTNQGTWFFQNTRISSTSGGNYVVLVPDDPNSPLLTTSQITTVNAIDISAYSNQNLVLSYERYACRYYDTLKVEVSNDKVNWVTVDNNTDFALTTVLARYITPNPDSRDLFLPINIVNGDSLYIRFNWEALRSGIEGIGYGFFIDDVMLLDIPANDLVLDQTAFFDDVRLLYSWYYGAMPERQAESDSLTFSATYYNRGKNNQTNSRLNLSVSGQGSGSYSSASSTAISGFLADTVRTSIPIALTDGMGTYSFTWDILSDSTDDVPSNNSKTIDLLVTGNEYCMPPLPISSANVLGKGGTATSEYILRQDYVFNATDTIYGLGVAFDTAWSRTDIIFQLSMIDGNDVVVTQSDYITSTEEMITNDMVYFSVPETYIGPGLYRARIEVFSADSLFVVNCYDPIPPIEPVPGATNSFFSRTRLSYGGSNFIDEMAYLSIITNDNIVCNTTTDITATVYDNSPTGIASIEITDVSGLGSPMYEYSWTGPSGYSSTSRNAEGIVQQATYTVTVTDVNRCTAIKSFDVAGKVDVNEISLDNHVSLFPNPNNGEFTLALKGLNGVYTISMKNLLGQVISVETVNVSGGMNKTISNRNLNKGVYLVEISDTKGASSVIRFVIE